MDVTYEKDAASGRLTSMALFSSDAVEEVFLTELFNVMCRPLEDDEICITRANGERTIVWKPIRGSLE